MTQEADPEFDTPEAFEAVRQELTMLHNAVLGLTAARERLPDYSATLAEMRQMLDDNQKRLATLQQSPSLRMTPAALVADIHAAAQAVRAEDRRMLDASRVAIDRSVGAINAIVQRGQAADRQHERLIWAACGGLVAGIVLWSILPGVIARSLPSSWRVPEWMAERTLGREVSVAGDRQSVRDNR